MNEFHWILRCPSGAFLSQYPAHSQQEMAADSPKCLHRLEILFVGICANIYYFIFFMTSLTVDRLVQHSSWSQS